MGLLYLFPLDLVLFPSVPLPLHIFEERYREMIGRCLSDGKPFGVALATSGPTVGGHAETAEIGTTAEIVQHRLLPDGRYLLIARGIERFRIVERLDDDPFPQASVEPVPGDGGAGVAPAALEQLQRLVRRYIGLSAEAGEIDAYADVRLGEDPESASFEAASIVRVPDVQRQALLEQRSTDRFDWLRSHLDAENQRLETAILSR